MYRVLFYNPFTLLQSTLQLYQCTYFNVYYLYFVVPLHIHTFNDPVRLWSNFICTSYKGAINSPAMVATALHKMMIIDLLYIR